MSKATLARQRAIGTIGYARVGKLDDAHLTIVDTDEYERLKAELAEAKRDQLLTKLSQAERDRDLARQQRDGYHKVRSE